MATNQGGSWEIQVECYAGYRAEETPRRFRLGANPVEIMEILDRWHGPDHRYFKVRGGDACVYILRHDEIKDRWEMVMMDNVNNATTLGS
ncbi:MAG: hypothetical protein PWQ57_3171 [Desulfovibrionales bacterium]|jgi:hypothetical protein|nr:hypothetical protein [Desulfovibrionales bacterium]